jgi:dTDP-4-amino-4,6-dideoxygalactose transaminase
MEVLNQRVGARRSNHDFYFKELDGTWIEPRNGQVIFNSQSSNSGIYFLKEPNGFFSNRWLTTVLVNPEETGGVTSKQIRKALGEENIECRPLWKPMHLQPLYKDFAYYGKGISDRLFEYGLCLPSGSNLSDEDRHRVVQTIKMTLSKQNVYK